MKLVIGAFLVAHALIHLSFLSPAPPRTAGGPEWPFELARSWMVTALDLNPDAARSIGTALAVATAILLVGAGLATNGWLLPEAWWSGLIVSGAIASLVTLLLFFHPWLVLGIAIDAVLLWSVLVASWLPSGLQP
jgi:hypothetical protein